MYRAQPYHTILPAFPHLYPQKYTVLLYLLRNVRLYPLSLTFQTPKTSRIPPTCEYLRLSQSSSSRQTKLTKAGIRPNPPPPSSISSPRWSLGHKSPETALIPPPLLSPSLLRIPPSLENRGRVALSPYVWHAKKTSRMTVKRSPTFFRLKKNEINE